MGLPMTDASGSGGPADGSRVAPAIAAWTTTPWADRHGVSRSRRWRRESGKEFCKRQGEIRSRIGREKVWCCCCSREEGEDECQHDSDPIGSCSSYLYVDRFFESVFQMARKKRIMMVSTRILWSGSLTACVAMIFFSPWCGHGSAVLFTRESKIVAEYSATCDKWLPRAATQNEKYCFDDITTLSMTDSNRPRFVLSIICHIWHINILNDAITFSTVQYIRKMYSTGLFITMNAFPASPASSQLYCIWLARSCFPRVNKSRIYFEYNR